MFKNKALIAWLTVLFVFTAVIVPAGPVYAASVNDLLKPTAEKSSDGKGIFDVLLGLLLGNLLGKVFNLPPGSVDKPGMPGGSLGGGKEVMGFYAEWWDSDTSSFEAYKKNRDTVKTIIPFWATLQADATVTDRGGKDHAAVVRFAHQNNAAVLLLVNNAKQNTANPPIHTLLSSPALRTKAIDNLEAYIKKYDMDGVNIDFEVVPGEDRAALTAFMRELYQRLKPQGYTVTIDVFPKTDESSDVAAAYDYAELAKYADKIVIMTYDNHGAWSGPGPIAPVGWVENNLKYALKFIPKNKLYLGVAGYGYDWSGKGVESVEYGAVQNLLTRFGATAKWDAASKSPYFTYTDANGVSHTVWYENSESLKFKLDLVRKYDIAGAALWKLGEEDPASWQVFRDKLR